MRRRRLPGPHHGGIDPSGGGTEGFFNQGLLWIANQHSIHSAATCSKTSREIDWGSRPGSETISSTRCHGRPAGNVRCWHGMGLDSVKRYLCASCDFDRLGATYLPAICAAPGQPTTGCTSADPESPIMPLCVQHDSRTCDSIAAYVERNPPFGARGGHIHGGHLSGWGRAGFKGACCMSHLPIPFAGQV
jgi:hypothetical protein